MDAQTNGAAAWRSQTSSSTTASMAVLNLQPAGMDRRRCLEAGLESRDSLVTSRKVFFTPTNQGVLHSSAAFSSPSLSLPHIRKPSAVLSVAQLCAPQSDPRGEEAGEIKSSDITIDELSFVL